MSRRSDRVYPGRGADVATGFIPGEGLLQISSWIDSWDKPSRYKTETFLAWKSLFSALASTGGVIHPDVLGLVYLNSGVVAPNTTFSCFL